MSRIDDINGRDKIEKTYIFITKKFESFLDALVPYLRHILRFISLPYCFFILTNWKKIKVGRTKVILDFLYIFFVLRSFPDNYSACRLWEVPKNQWKYYYGSNYNPFQRGALRKYVQPKKYEILYEDKSICASLCRAHSIPTPQYIGVIEPGMDFSNKIHKYMYEFPEVERFIVKPSGGKGGHAILIIEKENNELKLLVNGKRKPINIKELDELHIVQEYIKQHESLEFFSPSVNTTRIVTIQRKDQSVHIIGAYTRFGVGSSLVDNLSRGGVAAKIDIEKGVLLGSAVDRYGKELTHHPTSNKQFDGFSIPYWEQLCELAVKTQKDLSFYKLLGMDIAVSDTGPVLIEINAIYDNVDLEQVCGPILKDEKTLEAYHEYDLLINKKQKKLSAHNI